MQLLKRKTIIQVEYHAPSKTIYLKEANQVIEIDDEGNERVESSVPHRTGFNPGEDISNAPDEVKKIAQAFWD